MNRDPLKALLSLTPLCFLQAAARYGRIYTNHQNFHVLTDPLLTVFKGMRVDVCCLGTKEGAGDVAGRWTYQMSFTG